MVPRFGNLNGFAYNGVNYINRDMANVTTVPHEMLHNNTAADWRPVVGNEFDEGATEYLEQHALRTGGIHTTLTHYPNQRAVVEDFLAAGATQDSLFRAYLVGGAHTLVAQWVDSHCQGNWTQVKTATQASQWAVARASLAPRTAAPAPGGTPASGSQVLTILRGDLERDAGPLSPRDRLVLLEAEVLDRELRAIGNESFALGKQIIDGKVDDATARTRGRGLLDWLEAIAPRVDAITLEPRRVTLRRQVDDAMLEALYAVERKAMSPRLSRYAQDAGAPRCIEPGRRLLVVASQAAAIPW